MMTVALPHGRELELAVPDYGAGPWPVVVYLHGGGFVSGSHRAGDNPLARLLVEALLPRGIAVAGAEYRLADQATYPAPVDDAAAAVSWLQTHGHRHRLDGARIAAWGDSAGGYLTAMLAADAAITAGVSWYGPTDLRRQPRLGPPALGLTDPARSPESRALGAPVESVPELATTASPITHVTASSSPMLCVHGTRDDGVPPAQSERLVDTYRRAGAPAELLTLPGAGHGFHDRHLQQALTTSTRFLTHHLSR